MLREQRGCSLVGPAMLKGYHTSTACVFLLVFLLNPVSPQCRNAAAAECGNYSGLVPGSDLVGKGIDITTMQSMDIPLLNMTQSDRPDGTCTLCSNMVVKENPIQKLPLAVKNWVAYPVCRRKLLSGIKYHSVSLVETEELALNNEWKTKLNIPLQPNEMNPTAFAGSHSDLADFSKISSHDKFAFYYLSSNCSHYMFDISENATLSDNFGQAVQSLPLAMADPNAEMAYKRLIETYGTHFIKSAYLGGLWKEAVALRLCEIQLDEWNLHSFSRCLKAEYTTLLGFPQVPHNVLQLCGKRMKIVHLRGTFQERFKDRYVEIKGGNTQADTLFAGSLNATFYKIWLKNIKEKPALVSYSIEPIFNLVDATDPRRLILASTVIKYVKDRVMQKNCPLTCQAETHIRDLRSCSCHCVPNSVISSWCCTYKRGVANVDVLIQNGNGLKGDYFSGTDAYVVLRLQEMVKRTNIIWNNNSPVWVENIPFGYIDLVKHYTELTLEIYDKDSGFLEGWIDDLLGECKISLETGDFQERECRLKQGSIYYQYSVICGPYLSGPECLSYKPQAV